MWASSFVDVSIPFVLCSSVNDAVSHWISRGSFSLFCRASLKYMTPSFVEPNHRTRLQHHCLFEIIAVSTCQDIAALHAAVSSEQWGSKDRTSMEEGFCLSLVHCGLRCLQCWCWLLATAKPATAVTPEAQLVISTNETYKACIWLIMLLSSAGASPRPKPFDEASRSVSPIAVGASSCRVLSEHSLSGETFSEILTHLRSLA